MNSPGTVANSPFGPNMRSIVAHVDPSKLLEYNPNPEDMGSTLKMGNLSVKDSMPIVHNSATVVDIKKMGGILIIVLMDADIWDGATTRARRPRGVSPCLKLLYANLFGSKKRWANTRRPRIVLSSPGRQVA